MKVIKQEPYFKRRVLACILSNLVLFTFVFNIDFIKICSGQTPSGRFWRLVRKNLPNIQFVENM